MLNTVLVYRNDVTERDSIPNRGHIILAFDKWRATLNFMFEFPCIISLYYIKNQQYATLAVLLIINCKITLHVSDAFCVHHQEY